MGKFYLGSEELPPRLFSGTICSSVSDVPDSLSVNDVVFLSWKEKGEFRSAYPKISDPSISFVFSNETVNMEDSVTLRKREAIALEQEDYQLCKLINEAKIEHSAIKRRTVLDAFPAELQIESSNICNAQCIMCDHFFRQGKAAIGKCRPDIMDRLEFMFPYVRTIYLHGNGEPFLATSLPDRIREYARYGMRFSTNTNLSSLADGAIAAIRDNFDEINISCDAATASTYEYIRRGLSFETFKSNCRRLRASCPNLFMRMECVVMRQNVRELQAIVKTAASLGFDEVRFHELSPDRRLGNYRDASSSFPNIASVSLEEAIAAGAELGLIVSPPSYPPPNSQELAFELEQFDNEQCFLNNMQLESLKERLAAEDENATTDYLEIGHRSIPMVANASVSGICDWCIERPFVSLDGTVSLCCVNRYVALGNIFESDFADIWNSAAARAVRSAFFEGSIPYFCSGCEFVLHGMLRYVSAIDAAKLRKKIFLGNNSHAM